MSDPTPKVTVIVPNYNHAPYLRQRLESIFNQTYTDFEVILLDDASTDSSRDILAEYASRSNVRTEFNEANSGVPFRQWNKGVSMAQAEYVWIAESDDYAEPEFLAMMVERLDANPSAGLACCGTHIECDDPAMLKLMMPGPAWFDYARWEKDFDASGRDECARFMVISQVIPNASAVMFRRGVYQQVGGAPEDFRMCGDYAMWTRMLLLSDLCFVARKMNHFRLHQRTVRWELRHDAERLKEEYRVVREILDHCDVDPMSLDKACERRLRLAFYYLIERPAQPMWRKFFSVVGASRSIDTRARRRCMKLLYEEWRWGRWSRGREMRS
jgi:glycosyltransferase involved in cell wall biosynthesis